MSKVIRYFLQGLILMAPIAITIYAFFMLFEFVDGLLITYLTNLIGFRIPGLGLLIILITVTLIGFLGTTILFKPIISSLDRIISQAPLVKIIYTSIKDFMSAFVGKDKKFTEPVLVKVNKDAELEKLGFITQHDLTKLGIEKGKVAVYLPHSYNFSGNLFIVPAENVRPIDASPTEVMKFIVTAGVTSIPGSIHPEKEADHENGGQVS
jgi:uncharacterized membrane protein